MIQNSSFINYTFGLYPEVHQPSDLPTGISRIGPPVRLIFKLSDFTIDELQLSKYKIIKENNNICAICYDEYNIGKNIYIFLCKHHFCVTCIDKVKQKSTTCPICRTNIKNIDDINKCIELQNIISSDLN